MQPSIQKASGNYRPDIDGLRSIAVLAVILFHIDKEWLPGGFIGVDIFFVISGFLITGIISKAWHNESFSLIEFYRRRIRRIFPALSLVVIFTLVAGHFILLPDDLVKLSRSAIASQLFSANIYFTYFLDTSYFADDASLEPLLHTWSLGVEEQFYLIYPMLLVFGLARLGLRNVFILLCLTFFLSVVISELAISSNPSFAYYMLPTRAFQLLTGAMCYFIGANERLHSYSRLSPFLSMAGAMAIAFSLALVNESIRYPGLNALPVSLGTAAVILAGCMNGGLVNRFLALRAPVQIGLMSYSLYLWHWPVISFAKYLLGDLTSSQKLLCLILVFVLSWLSYILVEQPFRHYSGNFAKVLREHFIYPTVITLSFALFFLASGGYGFYIFGDSYNSDLANTGKNPVPAYKYKYVCQFSQLSIKDTQNDKCILGGTTEPRVVLWGDSNAAHYVGVMGEISSQFNFSFRNFANSACPPILEKPEQFTSSKRMARCAAGSKVAHKRLEDFDVIILSASWLSYMHQDKFLDALSATIGKLKSNGKIVVLLGVVPRFPKLDKECAMKSLKVPFINCFEKSVSQRRTVDDNNAIMKKIATDSGVKYYDVTEVLCDEQKCSSYVGNFPAYFDAGHLSMQGSIAIGKLARHTEQAKFVFSFLTDSSVEEITPLPWDSRD